MDSTTQEVAPMNHRSPRILTLALVTLLALGACSMLASEAGAAGRHAHAAKLSAPRYTTLDQAVAAGRIDAAVVRKLRAHGAVAALVTYRTEAAFSRASQVASHVRRTQRAASFLRTATAEIRSEERRTLTRIDGAFRVLDRYDTLPLTYVRFDSAQALLETVNAADVSGVRANERVRAQGVNSLPLIRQPETAAAGFTGAGTYVAVLDSGIRYRKSAFGCKKPGKPSSCRVAMTWDQAKNDHKLDDDGHGTNVSGIVAGVAPGTKLIVVDIFNGEYSSKRIITKAIDRIVRLKQRGRDIRAINLSLGDSAAHTGPCANSAYAPAFALARSVGILPVVAAGNDAYIRGRFRLGLTEPACVPGAISVGAVYAGSYGSLDWDDCKDKTSSADQIVCFSQTGDQLTLLAPGSRIKAAGISQSGTSQATPHVSGAIAVLAAANPQATIDQITEALAATGPALTDPRSQITRHRLDLAAAVAAIRGDTGGGGGGGDHTPPVLSGPSQGIPRDWSLGSAGATPLTVSWSASDASGIARYRLIISINGGAWRDITLGSATQTSITFNDLQPGSSYQFGVAAQDGAGNWSNWSYGPRSTVGLYNESVGRYSNGWEQLAWGQDLGGYQYSTRVASAYMTLDFTGREVAWIAPSSTLNGYAHVWLDNQDLGYVNEYSQSTIARKVQLSVGTSYGTHRLTIQAVGTSGHPQIDVDAFVVLS